MFACENYLKGAVCCGIIHDSSCFFRFLFFFFFLLDSALEFVCDGLLTVSLCCSLFLTFYM